MFVRRLFRRRGKPNQLLVFIPDKRYLSATVALGVLHQSLLGIPVIVRENAVFVGVSARQQCCVAGSGARAGVVVITVGEDGAVLKKKIEAALARSRRGSARGSRREIGR